MLFDRQDFFHLPYVWCVNCNAAVLIPVIPRLSHIAGYWGFVQQAMLSSHDRHDRAEGHEKYTIRELKIRFLFDYRLFGVLPTFSQFAYLFTDLNTE